MFHCLMSIYLKFFLLFICQSDKISLELSPFSHTTCSHVVYCVTEVKVSEPVIEIPIETDIEDPPIRAPVVVVECKSDVMSKKPRHLTLDILKANTGILSCFAPLFARL